MFGFLPGPCGCASRDDHSAWRSHFCGLCNTLRARYGLWSRWLINRDSTFLALTGSALAAHEPEATLTTCCNPLGKKRPLIQHQAPAEFAAAVTICGLAVKLRDDADDERGLRRRAAGAGAWLLRRAEAKARAQLAAARFPVDPVAQTIGGQSLAESGQPALAAAVEPTARTYGAIFGHAAAVAGCPAGSAALSDAGAALGRMIYTVDAFEDYEADCRRRRFNPLPPEESLRQEMTAEAVDRDLGLFQRALSALSFRRHGALIEAISGAALRQRTLGRLGMETPPPLPPEQPPADPRYILSEPKKPCGCRNWSCGACSHCCGGNRRRSRGSNKYACCEVCNCCNYCSCGDGGGGCDCGGCDCPGCDC
jgi:hypothetical protein